jgi:hypothetical protein
MPALGEYVNVYNSALQVLESKGFRVWIDKQADMFCAERNGWDLMAENPISLLGLVALLEHRSPDIYKEYWWKSEGSLDYRALPEEPPNYISITKR